MVVRKLPSLLTDDQFDRDLIKSVEPDWKKLLTCFQCGTCSASCPAVDLMDYTPRMLWEMVRLGLRDQLVESRTFWLCTQCYACTARCPRGIMTSETMRNLREWAVAQGYAVPPAILQMREAVEKTHNILNEDNAMRLIWSQNVEPALPQLGGRPAEGVEVLFFTGCVSAMYPMAYSIPRSLVQVLEQVGVSYAAMGGEEWCCGYPLYTAGMMGDVRHLAEHNVAQAQSFQPQSLVATCPSCYHTWSHIYPELDASPDFQVQHATELLASLIEQGRIKMAELPWKVTYHDPCDLGRKSGVYDAPRKIIQSIPGMTLHEMVNNREDALCCGGGGDVAMAEADVTAHIAARRLEQAVATGAEAIISSCQQCKRTLQQAARAAKTRIRVLDVIELVWQAMVKE